LFQGKVQNPVRGDKTQKEIPVAMLSLSQYLIKVLLLFAAHLSSPSLPTGRQAQGGIFWCLLNKTGDLNIG
jgi:hypothetical protein